jgi:hypothetical protein
MYPNVYLETDFTKEFDRYEESLPSVSRRSDKTLRAHAESLRRILDFLMSANVYSDFSEDDVKNSFTAESGFSKNLKEQIIRSTYKNDAYTDIDRRLIIDKNRESTFSNQFSLFIGDLFQDAFDSSEQQGMIVIGKEFLENPFFLNHSFASVATDQSLFQIQNIKHPCSSLVIIDKYVFKNAPKFETKFPNLLKVIEWLMPKGLSHKFEISIITENTKDERTSLISSKYNEIRKHFGDKVSLQIIAPKILDEVESSDRFILTNYAMISIPHPFDRPTTISCNFYPSHQEDFGPDRLTETKNKIVIEGYKTWEAKIDLAKAVIKKTPKNKIGTVKHVWKEENEPEHKIFNHK